MAVFLYTLVVGIPFLPDRDAPSAPGPDFCQPGRYIIQIHGTGSTGSFQPGAAIVNQLDPQRPDVAVFGAERNLELGRFFKLAADCVLTFSYDDVYLTNGGTRKAGVDAWNNVTSPWDRQPDELADRLQSLMDAYRDAKFDIVAYSAGGIIPTYWAARDRTSDAQRARVRSIVVVDGVVSGVDMGLFDLACATPLRNAHLGDFGRTPCQFRFDAEFTTAVRTSDWWKKIAFATVRADGDWIVWYDVAGLPGKTVLDPELRAEGCAWWELVTKGILRCVLRTHGSVLRLDGARDAIGQIIGARP